MNDFLRKILTHVRNTDILLLATACFSFWLALFLHLPQDEQHSITQRDEQLVPKEYIILNDPLLHQGAYSGLAEPSFEMRENVDFILTPAILVQEAILDGYILIYPEE